MRLAPSFAALAGLAALAAAGAANAANFDVQAYANSSSGGTGLETISLTAGQSFSVSVDPTDLWNAGALPRWSNADGLSGNLFATGSDDSTEAFGTLIGQNFGLYNQGNLSAAYGTLVGQIGSGDFFIVGTQYAGSAATSGMLKLYYWDSNFGDNTQYVSANVAAVPEPKTYALLLGGLAAVGFVARRRRVG
jgi:hypothetical protein